MRMTGEMTSTACRTAPRKRGSEVTSISHSRGWSRQRTGSACSVQRPSAPMSPRAIGTDDTSSLARGSHALGWQDVRRRRGRRVDNPPWRPRRWTRSVRQTGSELVLLFGQPENRDAYVVPPREVFRAFWIFPANSASADLCRLAERHQSLTTNLVGCRKLVLPTMINAWQISRKKGDHRCHPVRVRVFSSSGRLSSVMPLHETLAGIQPRSGTQISRCPG
ncbi:hypothetical protein ATI53_1002223 [Salipiger aestuarii]|uniref:Uncharacterized protein n=1 Tax=Salipiger aestuarii TaxID=568098 RepID=A0A327YPZ2_9RHOB|nr:hypothetical protein ATI53_1002223 [Salipiger aestuarii]